MLVQQRAYSRAVTRSWTTLLCTALSAMTASAVPSPFQNTSVASAATTFWSGSTRALARSPLGNVAAVSCHNCYVDWNGNTADVNLTNTLSKLHRAQADGADMLELDVKYESGVTYVTHSDDAATNVAKLSNVLDDAALKGGDQILVVEIKETSFSPALVTDVLKTITDRGYARSGRPVLIKAFTGAPLENLKNVRDQLNGGFASIKPYVKTAVLYPANAWSLPQFQQAARDAFNAGFHAMDLNIQTPNLMGVVEYAKSIGLGVALWTFPPNTEPLIAAIRHNVDYISADIPIATVRSIVTGATQLSHVNVAQQNGSNGTVTVYESSGTPTTRPVNGGTNPGLATDATGSEGLSGQFLRFVASSKLRMPLYDADNASGGGYVVSAVVNFDNLSLPDGATQVVVGKADSASFSLELADPSGSAAPVLRFGVFVNGAYRYATYPTAKLNLTKSYIVTGAYNGHGEVRMWIGNSSAGVTSGGSYTGGVALNNSPAIIGADPQGTTGAGYFFDGKIQQITIVKW